MLNSLKTNWREDKPRTIAILVLMPAFVLLMFFATPEISAYVTVGLEVLIFVGGIVFMLYMAARWLMGKLGSNR